MIVSLSLHIDIDAADISTFRIIGNIKASAYLVSYITPLRQPTLFGEPLTMANTNSLAHKLHVQ